MKKNLFNGGFTLVEILVVIMIVALLVTMAMPMYEKTVEKSRLFPRERAAFLPERRHPVIFPARNTGCLQSVSGIAGAIVVQ